MRINPSMKTLICLAIVSVLLLGLCGFIYKNRSDRLAKLQAQLKETETQVMESERTVKRLAEVEQEYLDAQAKLGVLEKGVSTKAYVPTLLRQLEHLGKSVNLRVVGVKPRPVAKKPAAVQTTESGEEVKPKEDPYDTLVLDIEVNGKYWDVVHFIQEITSFPKIVAVNEVHINPMGDYREPGSPKLSVRLNTTAFILKESPVEVEPKKDGASSTEVAQI